MKAQALVVQKITPGIPSSWAASRLKFMMPSETTQVTGGEFGEELSFERRPLKGCKQCFLMDWQRDGICWAATLASAGGRPSGIILKRKVGRPLRELGPWDLSRRLWINSVLTKVIWKPLKWRSLASFSIGFMWP